MFFRKIFRYSFFFKDIFLLLLAKRLLVVRGVRQKSSGAVSEAAGPEILKVRYEGYSSLLEKAVLKEIQSGNALKKAIVNAAQGYCRYTVQV